MAGSHLTILPSITAPQEYMIHGLVVLQVFWPKVWLNLITCLEQKCWRNWHSWVMFKMWHTWKPWLPWSTVKMTMKTMTMMRSIPIRSVQKLALSSKIRHPCNPIPEPLRPTIQRTTPVRNVHANHVQFLTPRAVAVVTRNMRLRSIWPQWPHPSKPLSKVGTRAKSDTQTSTWSTDLTTCLSNSRITIQYQRIWKQSKRNWSWKRAQEAACQPRLLLRPLPDILPRPAMGVASRRPLVLKRGPKLVKVEISRLNTAVGAMPNLPRCTNRLVPMKSGVREMPKLWNSTSKSSPPIGMIGSITWTHWGEVVSSKNSREIYVKPLTWKR